MAVRIAECPGCSHKTVEPTSAKWDGVMTCEGCGGLFTPRPVSRRTLKRYVNLDTLESILDDGGGMRYFDFLYKVSAELRRNDRTRGTFQRVHGWFNESTGEVVQFG